MQGVVLIRMCFVFQTFIRDSGQKQAKGLSRQLRDLTQKYSKHFKLSGSQQWKKQCAFAISNTLASGGNGPRLQRPTALALLSTWKRTRCVYTRLVRIQRKHEETMKLKKWHGLLQELRLTS